jgi:hypothetical protein
MMFGEKHQSVSARIPARSPCSSRAQRKQKYAPDRLNGIQAKRASTNHLSELSRFASMNLRAI